MVDMITPLRGQTQPAGRVYSSWFPLVPAGQPVALPPSPRHPQGAGGGHGEQRVSRGFRDTRDTKTGIGLLERRGVEAPDRGAQDAPGAEPVATADRAIRGRRVDPTPATGHIEVRVCR